MTYTNGNKLKIKEWAPDDRPREKLEDKGTESLSDAELIAILIGSGNKNESAVDVAKKILSLSKNNLNELGKFSIQELTTIKGIGKARAITIVAALELGRRRKLSEAIEKRKITSSLDIFNLFHPILGDLPHEEFWVLFTNRSNRIIDQIKISQGGISGTVIDLRIILKRALDKLASGIILCHNHPSGANHPSESDKAITKKVKDATALLDIHTLDHVIIANETYFSFADQGLLL